MKLHWLQNFNIGILSKFLAVAFKMKKRCWFMSTCQTKAWTPSFLVHFLSKNLLHAYVLLSSVIYVKWIYLKCIKPHISTLCISHFEYIEPNYCYRSYKKFIAKLEETFWNHNWDCSRDFVSSSRLKIKDYS